LIKALLAQPLSQPSLLLGMQRILNAASQAGARQPQQLLQQLLLPFMSFVMLQPDAQGDSSSLYMLRVSVVCGRWLFVRLHALHNCQWYCVADECMLQHMQCMRFITRLPVEGQHTHGLSQRADLLISDGVCCLPCFVSAALRGRALVIEEVHALHFDS